mmetsp:Transcript_14103/g.31767  ORF Transcript_14103/g.31767 Transcript_14103/m.31767 type:complete len:214 (+) Transcript_14103:421-1062(+)
MVHGKPNPKKTFTELLPVTLPMLLSAFSSPTAADLDAKVSGSEVPRATKVIAVTESQIPREQPSNIAKSPITAVTQPIITKEMTKQIHPCKKSTGGTTANNSFQGMATMCMIISVLLALAISDQLPPTRTASANCSFQFVLPNSISCQFTAPSALSTKVFFSASGLIFMVKMFTSLPPSVSAGNSVFTGSVSITRNFSCPSHRFFDLIFTSNV